MKKSMMGSSKYEFEPELFEKDIQNKREVAEQFKNDLREVLNRSYHYREGKMNFSTKRELLIEVHKEFIKQEE